MGIFKKGDVEDVEVKNEKRFVTYKYQHVISSAAEAKIKTLSDEEYEYFSKLPSEKARFFPLFANFDRRKLMEGVSEKEEAAMYEHCSKLAYQYNNEAQVFDKQLQKKEKTYLAIARGCFLVALGIWVIPTAYLYVFGQNKQLHGEPNKVSVNQEGKKISNNLLVVDTDGRYSLINTAGIRINNRRGSSTQMDVLPYDQYIKTINSSDFKCEPLNSIFDSYTTSNALPKCKTNDYGDTYYVGFAGVGKYYQMLMHVKKDGKLHNVMIGEMNFSYRDNSLNNVNFEMIMQSFSNAFPEAVVKESQDKLTERKLNK